MRCGDTGGTTGDAVARVCMDPVREEFQAKIQAPTLPPRMPPASAEMAAREFSADRDTMATPLEFWRKKAPMGRIFLANFHTLLLAAIGHMLQLQSGKLLE